MINSSEYKKIEESWFETKRLKKKRLKYLVNFIRGIEPGSKNYGIEGEGKRFIRVNDIGSNNKDNVYINLETDSICNKEDILLCLDGSPGIVVRGFEGIFSAGLRKLELKDKELDYNYLFYSLNCDFSQECISFFSKGTTIMHSSDSINYLKQLLPPKEVQVKISAHLDEATKKLNKVIENKGRQVDLLKENEKIIVNEKIHYANENYKSKRIKWSIKTTKGLAFKSVIFKEKGVIVIKATDLKNNTIVSNSDCFIEEKEAQNFEVVRLFLGDILMSTVGSWPWVFNSAVGQIAVVPKKYDGSLLNQNTVRLEPDLNEWNKKYLYYLLISDKYRSYLDVGAHGTANQASLSLRYILDFYHNIPSISDQEKISKKISTVIDMIRAGIQILQLEISKLEEYKKILINDVITGKMKVTA